MPKQTTEPPAPIRLTTNCIWAGKFYTAGEALPVASVADLTENLQKVVATSEPEAEEPNEPRGSFQTGVIYEMTPDGRLGRALKRKVERQVAELEAENWREEWIEEEANTELPPEIAAGLEDAHQSDVALQTAQAAAAARAADDIADGAIAAAQPAELFALRAGRHYVPIERARLKPDEPIFVRLPDGAYEAIGTTDSEAQPPDSPTYAYPRLSAVVFKSASRSRFRLFSNVLLPASCNGGWAQPCVA
jgi:hypothetical protein